MKFFDLVMFIVEVEGKEKEEESFEVEKNEAICSLATTQIEDKDVTWEKEFQSSGIDPNPNHNPTWYDISKLL